MIHVEGKDDRMVANNLEPHYLTHPGVSWSFVASVSDAWLS